GRSCHRRASSAPGRRWTIVRSPVIRAAGQGPCAMADSLILELADFEHLVHTGIYSEETGRPQPLRFSVSVRLKPAAHYHAETSLDASKNYMDLKFACSEALGDTHFKLIEAVAEHV